RWYLPMTDGARPVIRLVVERRHLNLHYLETLGVNIGVENQDRRATMVVESLALRFQSRRSRPDNAKADPHTIVIYPGRALSIPPVKLDYCTVPVLPNLHFLKYT